MYLLEICAGSITSALAAQQGGADRIELCENLAGGGTTPSAGTFAVVRKNLSIPIFVLIRPRTGDFLYTEAEYEAMLHDIQTLKAAGADGFVTGALLANGDVDEVRSSRFVEAAYPLPCTFHRAFDVGSDGLKNLQRILSCGYTRLLTSGMKPSAAEATDMLSTLVREAKDQLVIMPGGGISETNILKLKTETGAKEFHASLRSPVHSAMQNDAGNVNMGAAGSNERTWDETDAERVKKVKHLLLHGA